MHMGGDDHFFLVDGSAAWGYHWIAASWEAAYASGICYGPFFVFDSSL